MEIRGAGAGTGGSRRWGEECAQEQLQSIVLAVARREALGGRGRQDVFFVIPYPWALRTRLLRCAMQHMYTWGNQYLAGNDTPVNEAIN